MKKRTEVYKALGGHGTLGLEIVLSVVIGMLGGHWLDGRFGTEPWLFWGGFLFGSVAAVRSTMRALRRMRAEAEREERAHGNPAPAFETEADRRKRDVEASKQAEIVDTPDVVSNEPHEEPRG